MDAFPVAVAVVEATLVDAALRDALPEVDAVDVDAVIDVAEVDTLAVVAPRDVEAVRDAAAPVDDKDVVRLAPVDVAACVGVDT